MELPARRSGPGEKLFIFYIKCDLSGQSASTFGTLATRVSALE